jgi:NADPH2:quinone reductase
MVIASASSPEKRALALANGADHAVDSRSEDWRGEIKRLTEGRGVDVVVDPLGGEHTERAFRALRWGGRLVVIGFAAGDIPKIPTNLVLLKGGALLGVDMRQFSEVDPEGMADLTRRATALFDTGVARPPIGKVFPLSDYVAAMQAAQAGDSAGRIVLRMPAAAD